MPCLCVSLPEQRAVGTGSGSAPCQSRGHREVVHAQRGGLSPALLALCQRAGGAVAWSLLLIHLSGRQLEKNEVQSFSKKSNFIKCLILNCYLIIYLFQ